MDSRRMDSALGRQCGSIALFAKGTNAKFANLSQKAQSSHSPTAIPRILKEESGASPSLRDLKKGAAIHKTTAQKVDSSSLSLRADEIGVAIHKNTKDT